jgi:hypothetical protein
MIKIILGGIGSGKTLTAVKKMSETMLPVFTNVQTTVPNSIRLKWDMIMTDKVTDVETGKSKKVVNWDFWRRALKKYANFHIYADEFHNVMSSRSSMNRRTVNIMVPWVSQLRKICGSSEVSDFVAITQELSRVDVALRDLAGEIIYCEKVELTNKIPTRCLQNGRMVVKKLPITYIFNYYFRGTNCVSRYWDFREQRLKTYDYRTYFLANGFFKYYDSYQIVDFEETEYV